MVSPLFKVSVQVICPLSSRLSKTVYSEYFSGAGGVLEIMVPFPVWEYFL